MERLSPQQTKPNSFLGTDSLATPKKSRSLTRMWRKNASSGDASSDDDDVPALHYSGTTTPGNGVKSKANKKDMGLSQSEHTPRSPGLFKKTRLAKRKDGKKLLSPSDPLSCSTHTVEMSDDSSPDSGTKSRKQAPRRANSIMVLSPTMEENGPPPKMRSTKSAALNAVGTLDLAKEPSEAVTKKKTKAPRRGSGGALASKKSTLREERESSENEDVGYSSDGGLAGKKRALRAKHAPKAMSAKNTEHSESSNDTKTPIKHKPKKINAKKGDADEGGYSSDGGLATKKRAIRAKAQATPKEMFSPPNRTSAQPIPIKNGTSARQARVITRKASQARLLGNDGPESPESSVRMFPPPAPDLLPALSAAQLVNKGAMEEIAELESQLAAQRQELQKERQAMQKELEEKRNEMQRERETMQKELEEIAFQRESLDMQLQEEIQKNENLRAKVKELEENSSEFEELAKMNEQNKALEVQIQRMELKYGRQLEERDIVIEGLNETIKKMNDNAADLAITPSDGKSKLRLQGELLQIKSTLAEKEAMIEKQSQIIGELRDQLVSSSDGSVQKLQDRLRDVEFQKKELESKISKDSQEHAMKIKSKDEAIAFLIEELGNAKQSKDDSEHSFELSDSNAGTLALKDEPRRNRRGDDDLDSSQHSVGTLLAFAGFGRSPGGLRERYESRRRK